MEIDKNTTMLEVVKIVTRYAIPWTQCKSWIDQLVYHPCPLDWRVDFDTISFQQLIDMQESIKTYTELLFVPLQVLLHYNSREVWRQKAFDVVAMARYTEQELMRIAKLFEAIAYQPTHEEQKAGIKKLNFGHFGTIDWYARRMGISNHDEVVKLPWMIIYQCLKMDGENIAFQRKYRNSIQKQK